MIATDDLADAVAGCLAPGAPAKVRWDIAHPEQHRVADIVLALRRWLGFASATTLRVLPGAAGAVSGGGPADPPGWLGWRSPFRPTAIAQLAAGVVGDPRSWISVTGA